MFSILLTVLLGSNFFPIVTINKIPEIKAIRPIGENAKKPKGSKSFSFNIVLTTRLGGVPINVRTPPKLLANARGINSFVGLIFMLIAMLITTGNSTATVPVLLIRALKSPTVNIMMISNRVSLFFPN